MVRSIETIILRVNYCTDNGFRGLPREEMASRLHRDIGGSSAPLYVTNISVGHKYIHYPKTRRDCIRVHRANRTVYSRCLIAIKCPNCATTSSSDLPCTGLTIATGQVSHIHGPKNVCCAGLVLNHPHGIMVELALDQGQISQRGHSKFGQNRHSIPQGLSRISSSVESQDEPPNSKSSKV